MVYGFVDKFGGLVRISKITNKKHFMAIFYACLHVVKRGVFWTHSTH